MVNVYQPQFFVFLYPQTQQFPANIPDFPPAIVCYTQQKQNTGAPPFNSSKQMHDDLLLKTLHQDLVQNHSVYKETEARLKIQTEKNFGAAFTQTAKKKKKTTKYPQHNAMRNILPNIIHQIFCFLGKQKRSGLVVKKILPLQNYDQQHDIQKERYYCYQKLIRSKSDRYLNMNSLRQLNIFQEPGCQIFSHNQQVSFIKMNRILAKYYLEHEFETVVLTSYRMSPQTRIWNLQMRRKILNQIHQIFAPKRWPQYGHSS